MDVKWSQNTNVLNSCINKPIAQNTASNVKGSNNLLDSYIGKQTLNSSESSDEVKIQINKDENIKNENNEAKEKNGVPKKIAKLFSSKKVLIALGAALCGLAAAGIGFAVYRNANSSKNLDKSLQACADAFNGLFE